jgi:predicted dehydrogenase
MQLNRRTFLASSTAGLAALSTRRASADANSTVVLALMGANNRGSQLATQFAKLKGVEFAYVCDPDERAIGKGIEATTSNGGKRPEGIKDFRKALENPAVDALVVAAPNHWHATAMILACAAGKHVYVEKPCCQTPEEGERMIAAAQTSSRVVQVGTQRRSGPLYREAMERIHSGEIGDVLLAKSWYYDDRPSIGHGKPTEPPSWLDYNLWQGPAPEQPFRDNILHYNWHFFWHWGNGEIGNNGVHTVDLCRWALGIDYPTRVTAVGGRYRFDDDQQTPDTLNATWECNGKVITWQQLSWSRPIAPLRGVGIEVRGTKGSMQIDDGGCATFDHAAKLVNRTTGGRGDAEHLQNFLDAISSGTKVNTSIEEGHKSALMCHLGNISYRTGKPVEVDPTNGRLRDSALAAEYWQRKYRPGWLPPSTVHS